MKTTDAGHAASQGSRQPRSAIVYLEVEPPQASALRRVLAGIALTFLGLGLWLFASARPLHNADVKRTSAASTTIIPDASAQVSSGYRLTDASWDNQQPVMVPPPEPQLTEAEAKQAAFAEQARTRWKGTEIFQQRR